MMFYFSPLVIYIPVGIYLFHFFRRFLKLFVSEDQKLPTNLSSILFAVLCAVAGWRVYGLGAVIILHFTVIMIFLEGVNQIVKRVLGTERRGGFWKIVFESGLVGILIVSIVFSYGYFNMHHIRETKYSVRSSKIPSGKIRIAQISDLHMGTTMDVDALKDNCDRIQKQQPDMFVLTGDIFDERTGRSLMEEAVQVLAGVSCQYGIYYVWGNHDTNRYRYEPEYTMDELRQTLIKNGIHVLEDEAVQVTEQFAIVGRYDVSNVTKRKSIQELVQGIDPSCFLLLLDHRPVELKENAGAGVDLQMSGHTHAGQIWPTGQLGEIIGVTEKNYGMERIGNFHIIVSSGIAGWGYGIRTGGHSEFVIADVEAG